MSLKFLSMVALISSAQAGYSKDYCKSLQLSVQGLAHFLEYWKSIFATVQGDDRGDYTQIWRMPIVEERIEISARDAK